MKKNQNMSLLDSWRETSSKKHIPFQATLELTNRCNERCTHCYIDDFSDDPKRVLSLDDWFHVLTELRANGAFFLILMGGEAMLSPFFFPILKKASSLGFHSSTITNGLLINSKEVALRLKEDGLQVITFSLYSLDEKIHDSMTTVVGSHKRLLNAISFCQEVGLKVGVNCLLTQKNIDGFFELAQWCLNKGIEIREDTTVTPKYNGDTSTTMLRATLSQIENYYLIRARLWPNSIPKAQPADSFSPVCNVARGKCAVTAYGDVLGCVEVREALGNIKEDSFKNIWNGVTAQKLRGIKNKDLVGLPEGEVINFCDHCAGMSQHETGDLLKVTDYSKELARIKKKVAGSFSV